MLQRGECEIHPDCTLNDQNKKYRHTRGKEGKQKDCKNCQYGDYTCNHTVYFVRFFQIIFTGRISDYQNFILFIILSGNLMHFIKECKCLISFFRKSQINKHSAVVLTLQLLLCHVHFGISIAECFFRLFIQRDIPFLHFIIKEHNTVY